MELPDSVLNTRTSDPETGSAGAADNLNVTEISGSASSFDYSYVPKGARIAIYDDLLSAPQIIEVDPAPTRDFLGELAKVIYEQAQNLGGLIPYTAIKQVSENFIHAQFEEMVVSILDKGNTIRFTDQGPGIAEKNSAMRPGFSSATKEMKRYIDGVGSGLPIVKEYLDVKNGKLFIEDNMNGGSVITLTLAEKPIDFISREKSITPQVEYSKTAQNVNSKESVFANIQTGSVQTDYKNITPSNMNFLNGSHTQFFISSLSKRSRDILPLLLKEDLWGVQEISNALDIPLSSTHTELGKLEQAGFIQKVGKKRTLTELGREVANSL